MPAKPSYQDRNTYIPHNVQSTMTQHMEASMPAHLKKYVTGNQYIPQHAQKQIEQHMQSSMPTHLKQYAGAYMQQKVATSNVRPAGRTEGFQPVAPPAPYKPVTHLDRESHYYQYGDPTQIQPGAEPMPTQSGQLIQPGQSDYPAPQAPHMAYDFIMNPDSAPKRSIFNSTGPARWLLIIGCFLAVFIVLAFVKSLFNGPSIVPSFISIAQDQQAMIHILATAKKERDLNVTNQNFVGTAVLSLPSDQTELLKMLATSGAKVKTKDLGLKISLATDQELAAAGPAGNYNAVLKKVMQAKLTAYKSHMKQTYNLATGKTARDLLNKQYHEAELLEIQLNDLHAGD